VNAVDVHNNFQWQRHGEYKNLSGFLDSNVGINQWNTASIEISLPNGAHRKT